MSKQHSFYGHGKLLLTSEYFIMDGALGLALPTKHGQNLEVIVEGDPSPNPKLYWKGFAFDHACWINVTFDLERLDVQNSEYENHKDLQRVLCQARNMNPNFLVGASDIHVTTSLEFPNNWGLGSSSTLIYMVSQWAKVCPFELLKNTFGGSGYDVACARAKSAMTYQVLKNKPVSKEVDFNPPFEDSLYFVHLNKKQDSRTGVQHYRDINPPKASNIERLNIISKEILEAQGLDEFESCLHTHEQLIGNALQIPCIKATLFNDYWGVIKSLGAWGGDFVLATSNRSEKETRDYFNLHGYKTVLKYNELILKQEIQDDN